MKTLHLIDVSSMFFRAFYAIRPLTSPSGVPVNAVYGFLSMITKLIKDEQPQYMVFCYDRKEPSFRRDLYEAYKANRTEMPEDLAQQIPYIKKLADLLGIASLEVPRFEADDLIGTLAVRGYQAGFRVHIVSGDKDFAQLVNERVLLCDTMKDVRYGPEGVQEKWGIRPDQMIDYLAIVGDSSDNIPGVMGIGEKGALKLLQQFSSLEEIYARLDEVAGKSIKEKLIASREQAFLAKKLVTIVTDVDVPQDFEGYRLRPVKREELRELLRELNFKNFEKTLLGDENAAAGTVLSVAAPVAPPMGAEPQPKGGATLAASGVASAFATEIVSMSISGLSSAIAAGSEVWVHADARGLFVASGGRVFGVDGPARELGPVADKAGWRWSGYDLKQAWHELGCETPRAEWDGALAAYAVHAGDVSDLPKVLNEHLGRGLPELASPVDWFAAQTELREVLSAKMRERSVEKVYREFDLPLAAILLRMEKRGVRIDAGSLQRQSEELDREARILEKEIQELAGEEFKVGSPKQLSVILFEKLGLESGRKTKTGYSTDNEVLEKIEHPIAAKVLTWRELTKLKSTYVDALPQLADAAGRVHTTFNQVLAATGRLSSTAPNLQNIPIRTERGRRVRQAFVAAEGCLLLSVDYSQIELRVLAHISGDPGLCRAFAEDLDIHAATAAEVFGVPLASVTADQRRAAKAVNFGIAYGQGAFGLAETLGIPRGEAQGIIKSYFEKFAGVKEYIESTTKLAHEQGYVETLFGRRRYLPELSSKNGMLRKFGERAAINAPIQGTAADLVKKAMIDLEGKVRSPMLLQVHDELIFEEREAILREDIPRIRQIMESVATLKVPLKVNAELGPNWDEAH